jgi:hypothetical protein
MGIGQITRSFSSSFSSFDHPSRRSSPLFSGSPVRGVCEAGFSRADPRQSETKSNRIQRLLVQLTRPSRTKQANNSFNCYSVAQSTIKQLTCPRVPGSWPHCRWESPKRWTFRGLACPPSPAKVSTKRIQLAFELLQLRHQPSSRATRIKPSSLQQAPQLLNPVSRTILVHCVPCSYRPNRFSDPQ